MVSIFKNTSKHCWIINGENAFLYANRILRSYREALRKGGAEAELAKAKAATGWAFMSTFVPLGYFGVFGGSDVAGI